MLWKLAELTDETVDQSWKLKSAMEILADAVPSEAIALFTALDANDAHLESIPDDVTALTRTIKDSFENANDDHLASILDRATTFMEATQDNIATDSNRSIISGFGSATILAITHCRIGS